MIMTCKVIQNDDGELSAIVCGSAWGVGVYSVEGEFEDESGPVYGYAPRNIDPHDFSPDIECCTPEEIAAWERAKAACSCGLD